MVDDINKVRRVVEVDPNVWASEGSSDVNDYLDIDGWILLNTGTHSAKGDSGPYSWIYYSVGWIGDGEPQVPPPVRMA